MADPTPVYRVTYNPNGGTGSTQYASKVHDVPLTLSDGTGFSRSYYTVDGWATSASGAKAYNLGGTYTENKAIDLYAHWKANTPNPVTNLTATRNSDTKVTVKWTLGAGSSITYLQIYVERRTNGVGWSVIATLQKTATSYIDTTTSANNRYEYRVIATGVDGGNSGYVTSGVVYMTPAEPSSLSGVQSGANVVLTVGNDVTSVRNATGFDVQERSSGSSTWVASTVISSSGTPVQSITVAGTGGDTYYRVRNTRGTLASAWRESGVVSVIVPPNAPILLYPASGGVIGANSSSQSVTFEWLHNSRDGSTQTAANIRYKKSTASSWTTTTATTAQSKAITLDVGYEYVWQVQTKGAAANYSDWSTTQTFALYAPPTVSITSPSGTVTNMPINYTVSFTDSKGTFVSGTFYIYLNDVLQYSEPIDGTLQGTITAEEFLPSSGNTYNISVSATSSTTLTRVVTVAMPVSMGEPNHGTLTIENDPDTGYSILTVGWDENTGAVPAVSANLYRIVDGETVLLGSDLSQDSGIVDKYAPLNTPYQYKVSTVSAGDAWTSVYFDNTIETLRWFAIWDGGEKEAWAEWNPTGSYKLKRPQKKRVHYVGREYPVSYDGTALDETHSITFTVVDMDSWSNGFIDLMHDGGRGVYKSVDGKVFWADFEITNTPNYTSITRIGTVGIDITRIEGDAV